LRQFAGQHQFRHHVGVTYVAIDEQRVPMFLSIRAIRDAVAVTQKKSSDTSFAAVLMKSR
jgi:hypothetical protein